MNAKRKSSHKLRLCFFRTLTSLKADFYIKTEIVVEKHVSVKMYFLWL